MQAIRTRYHGPTNTRGSRISAQCAAGKLSVPFDPDLDGLDNHRAAADALIAKLKWQRIARDGRWEHGVFDGDFYWIARS